MAEGRQTVAGAYAKIEGHEELCAERYKGIHDAITDLKGTQRTVSRGVWAVVAALLGWMALQLWEREVVHPPAPAPSVAVAVSPTPAGPTPQDLPR